MYDYLLYSSLKKHSKAQRLYHVPGHKGSLSFRAKFKDAGLDVTELSYTDNLISPTSVIAKAQKDIAEILGAKASFMTTDGSSSGVFALVYCAAKKGNRLIVFRNSHQSVWNACKLFGVEPLTVQGEERDGVMLPPDVHSIESLISKDSKIAGVLATSPDYYGNVAPLEEYAAMLKKYNRLLLVDEAHGAHLAFGDRKLYAGSYADMWVDGAHKTLTTLTQGAIVSVNNEGLLKDAEDAMAMFRTTSPSFPIMASIEYGVKSIANKPESVERAKQAVEEFKAENEGELTFYKNDDWTKLLVDFKPLNISADKALEKLEKAGVYAELSDGRYILFYLSPATRAMDLTALKRHLKNVISNRKIQGSYKEKLPLPKSERMYSFQYALKYPSEWVDLQKAEGRMCAQNAGIMPPCIPVVVVGEFITAADIKVLSQKNTFGIKNGKICVVKK